MIKAFNRFTRAAKLLSTVAKAEAVGQWTPADASALSAYMASDTGKKFVATLRWLTFTNASAAIAGDPAKLAWLCGHAAGMQSLAAQIDLLARWTGEHEPIASGPTDNLTWLYGNSNDTRNPEG